jgi:polar amino acid transport system substrate-binding protein
VGFDIDIIKAVAQKAGLQVQDRQHALVGIFASLNNGDIDLVVSGVTINDKRKQSYDFTAPYFEARQLIAVHGRQCRQRPEGPERARRWAWSPAARPTTSRRASSARPARHPPLRQHAGHHQPSSPTAGVDAAIGDNGVIAYRVQEHKGLKTVNDPALPKDYFGIVVKKGNTALLDKLNKGLAAIIADGTYAQIYKKWFQAERPRCRTQ